MSRDQRLGIIFLMLVAIVLIPWWFSYYRPPGHPWEWGQLVDERWDTIWLFGVMIKVGSTPGAIVCFMFSNFFWVRPTGNIPSYADLWARSMFIPYAGLFPALYFVLALVFLSFLFMINGELRESMGQTIAGSFGFLLAPLVFYAYMSHTLLSQAGSFTGGFYVCFILCLIGFINAFRMNKQKAERIERALLHKPKA